MATQKQKDYAWENAQKIRGKDPDIYRRDENGIEIYYSSYGKMGDKSWEVDHRVPVSKGGTEHLRNIRALNTWDNRDKGNRHPDPFKK